MTIATIQIADPLNPVEVQTWLDEHSQVTIHSVMASTTLFYIVYS